MALLRVLMPIPSRKLAKFSPKAVAPPTDHRARGARLSQGERERLTAGLEGGAAAKTAAAEIATSKAAASEATSAKTATAKTSAASEPASPQSSAEAATNSTAAKIRDGNDEVADGIDLCSELALGVFGGRDLQHFVADDLGQL